MQNTGPRNRVPREDQRKALALYCELAVQRGSISDVLELSLLLWELWRTAKSDNRNGGIGLAAAPLVPLLQKFEVPF